MKRYSGLKETVVEYRFPLDNSVKRITSLTFLTPLAITGFFAYLDLLQEPLYILIIVSTLAVPAIAFLLSPKKVVLAEERMIIEKIIGKIEIPYEAIKEIDFIERPKMTRIFGSGGLFGYFGIFNAEGVGKVRVYAKRSRDFVLIKADRNYVVAPEKPEEFIENLKIRVGK